MKLDCCQTWANRGKRAIQNTPSHGKSEKKMLLQRTVDVITDTVLKVRLCCSSCQGVGVGKALELQKV